MTDARVGVVGLPGGWSSEALADAFGSRTGTRILIDMERVVFDAASRSLRFGEVDLGSLDAVVIKKIGRVYSSQLLDHLEILDLLTDRVPVFSPPEKTIRILNRLACTTLLRRADIPMPPTVATCHAEAAVEAIRRFGKAVLKPLFSTKARGMQVATAAEAESVVERFQSAGNETLYVQKFLTLPGRDLGVVFLGEEYLGTYARIAGAGSWNTTVRDGGRYGAHEPGQDVVALARRAREVCGLEFTSVDIAETENGPLVLEVSAFGGFRGLRDGLGLDVATMYADHVLKRIGRA